MEYSSSHNIHYTIDTLPNELQLHICEYLPTDTLRLLFELNKHWKNTLIIFYGKCRYLAVDSYQNTLWALSRFRQIENISLRSGYPPSDNILMDIATSKSCTRLRRVDFSVPEYSLNVPVVNHGLRALAESPSCATLESLNLNRVSVRFFAPLTRFSHLTSLQLNSVGGIGDRDISNIVSSCTRLQELDLGSSLTTDRADNVLVEFAHYCRNLRVLSVEECRGITGKTLGQLFTGCSQLTKLDLGGCYRLQDFKSIVAHTAALQWLSLFKCVSITNDFMVALCASCTRLQFLNLSGCDRLTDETLRFVGQLPALKELRIGHCQFISRESIDEFEEAHPSISVLAKKEWQK
jgi:hypothetical protein